MRGFGSACGLCRKTRENVLFAGKSEGGERAVRRQSAVKAEA